MLVAPVGLKETLFGLLFRIETTSVSSFNILSMRSNRLANEIASLKVIIEASFSFLFICVSLTPLRKAMRQFSSAIVTSV